MFKSFAQNQNSKVKYVEMILQRSFFGQIGRDSKWSPSDSRKKFYGTKMLQNCKKYMTPLTQAGEQKNIERVHLHSVH